jgi:hypothetical protein
MKVTSKLNLLQWGKKLEGRDRDVVEGMKNYNNKNSLVIFTK